ncbi:MAG: beta-N-acetylhexosaminidase [Novosphingobium sp.]|nr:beta-N-acetylhexosaminidase [Novosphingobium sp.]
MTPAIFGLSGTILTPGERAFFGECDPAGYILFGRNIESRDQLRALTDEVREIHGRERTLICIDQEGGRVARMKPPVWASYPPGAVFDQLYDLAPASAIEAARANAEALGLDLAQAGITVDCLPLLDVRQPGAHDVIGDRALGAEPLRVAALGRAVLDGLAAAGVAGVVKHIPGHGRAHADSHVELPTVTATEAELERDIAPFRTLTHAPAGRALIAMTAHVRYTAWDADNPATQSRFVIEEIVRNRIGFDGLLLSDDLDMEALAGSVPKRAEQAVAAGCDIALNCWANMDDMIGIADRLPAMSELAAARLERALAGTSIEARADLAARQAECVAKRDALLALIGARV